MGLSRLDHVNVNTSQLVRLITFYTEVLGMTLGPRPNFSFGGAWLYCGDVPAVHLVERSSLAPLQGDLRLQHFAFKADDLAGLLARLGDLELPYRVNFLEDFELCQVALQDPDGNHLHVDFALAEARRLGVQPTPRDTPRGA